MCCARPWYACSPAKRRSVRADVPRPARAPARRAHAAAPHADVDLDVDVELRAGRGDGAQVVDVIHANADSARRESSASRSSLPRADHLVGDQHVGTPPSTRARLPRPSGSTCRPRRARSGAARSRGIVGLRVRAHPARPALDQIRQACAGSPRTHRAVHDERRRIDVLKAIWPTVGRRALDRCGGGFLPALVAKAYQTMAAPTTATIGSAKRLTRSQPAVVTVMPEVKEEIAIMMKIAWSLAPWALARSSGR